MEERGEEKRKCGVVFDLSREVIGATTTMPY